MGFFLGVCSLADPLGSVLVSVLYGLVLGASIGVFSPAVSGGDRHSSSVAASLGFEAEFPRRCLA